VKLKKISVIVLLFNKLFSGCTAVMDVLSCPIKEDDTDVEDETVEEQTALYNILSSKDTNLDTEFIIKNEEEIGDTSLLYTKYSFKDKEEEGTSILDTEYERKDEVKEELEDIEVKDEGSSVEYEHQLKVEPKG
jgi:hypothetical protein